MSEEPPTGHPLRRIGVHGLHRLEDGRTVRIIVTERQLGPSSEPTLQELSAALVDVYGTDFGIHSPTWISRFTDMTRQAAAYRIGRVLLAGDAAHVHYPAGGQGLSLGVQDAVNLGWKLAQVVNGNVAGESPRLVSRRAPPRRRPSARAHVGQGALQRRTTAARTRRDRVGAGGDGRAEATARRQHSGLDIRYDLGEGHPLLGRRMPDLDLVDRRRRRSGSSSCCTARGRLLNLGQPGGLDISRWAERVQLIDAGYDGGWELRYSAGRRPHGRAGPPGRLRGLGGTGPTKGCATH